MKLAVYGGAFNPPHLGHLYAAKAVLNRIRPDKLIVIPTADPPHKSLAEDTPSNHDRLELLRRTMPRDGRIEISDTEILRHGKSYTRTTVEQLLLKYPDAEIFLMIGTDMLETFEQWYSFKWILEKVTLVAFGRRNDEAHRVRHHAQALRDKHGARIMHVENRKVDISSTRLRAALTHRQGLEYLTESAYGYIIKKRLYNAQPDLKWLRERSAVYLDKNRIAHVRGCEQEAVSLAQRWGADEGLAAESAVLHDITKNLSRDKQLKLYKRYGIMTDKIKGNNIKLYHAETGACFAKEQFGIPDCVADAIFWHTTGKPGMSLLAQILYMADYIEPGREFDGVEALRSLAYENLDGALALGLKMSIDELTERGRIPHSATISAYEYFNARYTGSDDFSETGSN